MDISFDPAKRAETLRHRGLNFADAGKVFAGRTATQQDDRFDYGEVRYITAGYLDGRCVVLIWTPRGEARPARPPYHFNEAPMRVKKQTGSEWINPDDAPFLTKEMREKAEVFIGNDFQPPTRGRPKLAQPKEAINLRLDHDVLTKLREHGPGWQTRINEILRTTLELKEP